jgi:outer membrane protein OmpA-like peptidoglycan-associated protein
VHLIISVTFAPYIKGINTIKKKVAKKIKIMKQLKFILLAITLFCFTLTQAQVGGYFSKFRPSKKWSVGLQISPTHLNGDADDAKIGLSGGAHLKYSISQSFGLKLSGDIGMLKGGRLEPDFSGNKKDGRFGATTVDQQQYDDGTFRGNAGDQAPTEDSYEFTNNFKDLDLTAVYTLGNISFLRPLRKLQLFTFFGVGTIWSDVKGSFTAEKDAQSYYAQWGDAYLLPQDADGNTIPTATAEANPTSIKNAQTIYQGRNLTIPFGIGVKRNFGRWLDLGFEWRSHWTRSDGLDGFSFPVWRNRYADFYTLVGIQASVKLGTKGENEHYDWLNPLETIYADMDSMKQITNDLKTLIEDKDGDGVGDFFDKEDSTDCDKVYGNGKAVDSDGDGINDCKDKQIFSICDDVDENGVAKDKDGDGVPDCIDEEPNSVAGVLVDVRGKAAKAGNDNCCNCDKVTLPTIIFENGSSKIAPSSYGVLYAVAEKMKACPGLNISATGYTANKSGELLANRRSTAIIDHLEANYGIERSRIGISYSTGSGVEYNTRRVDLNQTSK